jgi:hypothetical protein
VGSLSNNGETIKIEDADNSTVVEFKYEDGKDLGEEGWHPETDGDGFSLVVVDQSAPLDDWNKGAGWRSSSRIDGSPGAVDPSAQAADFNGDGVVNRSDVVVLLRGYGQTSGATRTTGDANGDRRTTLHDLALLQSMLTPTNGSPSPPSAHSLLAEAVVDSTHRQIDESPKLSISALRAVRRTVSAVGQSTTLLAKPNAMSIGQSRAQSRSRDRAPRLQLVDSLFSES